ncbi:helix-turn-helix domain-containing protein [Melampsora larici-populina 98AG31]|uniref:Helix-turn-helix domain-containing protein n=1 Tax=Melampsora larici-populina (strain 98AG31 / pathotype 3-4-7) TaxID=747676 RepID=F4R328_MELLP|nr:helix-turn-helix domain-containing protein [Melampsora larici-populina 98AG31]EGG13240.1 helix-turn-helix domain-containing protein [Melampsora larici-populina 98AG31]
MSRSESRTISHPIRVYFTGEAGAEVAALLSKNKGFISHHASISTSGMNGGEDFANPINVTAYGSTAEALIPQHIYSMSCKFIGSNDERDDHLHFENAHRINWGPTENFPESFCDSLMDKVSIVALGTVVARDIIKDPVYKGKPTVVVTTKSTDYDPITKGPVSWLMKHFIPPLRNLEKAQNLCQLGRELQLVGVFKDYDTNNHMWEIEVNAISVTSGHLTGAAASPTKPGMPNGGQIPLGRKRGLASNVASTSTNAVDNNEFKLDDVESSPGRRVDGAIENRLNTNAGIENDALEKDSAVLGMSKRLRRG